MTNICTTAQCRCLPEPLTKFFHIRTANRPAPVQGTLAQDTWAAHLHVCFSQKLGPVIFFVGGWLIPGKDVLEGDIGAWPFAVALDFLNQLSGLLLRSLN